MRGGEPPKPECSFKTNAALLEYCCGPSKFMAISSVLCPPAASPLPKSRSRLVLWTFLSPRPRFWSLPNPEAVLLRDTLPLLNAKLCPLCCHSQHLTRREDLFWKFFFLFFFLNCLYGIYREVFCCCLYVGFSFFLIIFKGKTAFCKLENKPT